MFFKIFILVFLFFSTNIHAYNTFHPEVDPELNEENIWVNTAFDKKATNVRTSFRAWMPHEAKILWPIMIDTNNWKNISKDYNDSRALDEGMAKLLENKQPQDIKELYKLICDKKITSDHGRLTDGKWTSYALQRFAFPFPLKDRWTVIKIKNDESSSSKSYYRYDYKMIVSNFKKLEGYWELTPIPNKPGWTEWRVYYESDPGINIPHFLAKSIYRSSLKKSAETYSKVASP